MIDDSCIRPRVQNYFYFGLAVMIISFEIKSFSFSMLPRMERFPTELIHRIAAECVTTEASRSVACLSRVFRDAVDNLIDLLHIIPTS